MSVVTNSDRDRVRSRLNRLGARATVGNARAAEGGGRKETGETAERADVGDSDELRDERDERDEVGQVDDLAEPVDAGQVPAQPRAGRRVRRWLPESLRQARWEPGRPGAVLVSVVAALAAVIAAVGVWVGRPVAETAPPAPNLPTVAAAAGATAGGDAGADPGAGGVSSSANEAPEQIVVSVVGRVARPGLLTLPEGARVADALEAAGGALPGTDLTALNLARQLDDGQQLLVGIAAPPGASVDSGVMGPADDTGEDADGGSELVNLNTASQEELESLPGVGPVTAEAIIEYRETNRGFRAIDQLHEVSGIGEARFARLRDLVTI